MVRGLAIVGAAAALWLTETRAVTEEPPSTAPPAKAPETSSALSDKSAGAATESSAAQAVSALNAASTKQLFRGKVAHLGDALDRRGVRYAPEVREHVVLETDGGKLIPLLADWRGRAFYQDERLRDRDVTLVGQLRPDVGYLQVLMVFTYDDADDPQFTDYWCDICAIPMYELKPCECCQGDIRLRFQPQSIPSDLPKADDPKTP